nr:PREDICTED: heparanase-like protein 2 [Musa acuminata subsp. malaccensis]
MATADLVLSLLLLFSSLPSSIVAKDDPGHVNVSVQADYVVARTDGNFICATVDWWPPEKCDFGDCSWGNTSIKNLVRISVSSSRVIICMHAEVCSFVMQSRVSEAKDVILGVRCDIRAKFDAVVLTAFGTMRVRLGGTLQDQVKYTSKPCHEFKAADGDSNYEFIDGCISLNRWDKIHEFFNTTGSESMPFMGGLKDMMVCIQVHGTPRMLVSSSDTSSRTNNTSIHGSLVVAEAPALQCMHESLSFSDLASSSLRQGNELCGNGGKSNFLVDGNQYGLDLIAFKAMLIDEYAKFGGPPKVAAPGGFYVEDWYKNMLSTSGYGVVDIVTHHVYNLGSGGDGNLVDKVTDPKVLDNIVPTYNEVVGTIKSAGPWSSAWVGESGGAHSSGGKGLSNTFANSFWYLDQLGMVSRHHHKVFCRQTLIGGNYGLLDHDTFVPNPDYYSALLWHRLMGTGVLEASHDGHAHLRSYAHCSKNTPGGVTLLLINLSDSITFEIEINGGTKSYEREIRSRPLAKDDKDQSNREAFHLTPKDGDIQSTVMLLNGKELMLDGKNSIPALDPMVVEASDPLRIAPRSIAFVKLKDFNAAACR